MHVQTGSRRWTHFHSALQLAIQRSTHKWTFEDFTECFPLYVEEEKNGPSAVFNAISGHMESQMHADLDELFAKYGVQKNIDILHAIVTEAKERSRQNETRNDVWREDLDPHNAVSARTVPILEAEVQRMRELVAEEAERNKRLQAELEENRTVQESESEQAATLLDKVARINAACASIPQAEIEEWDIQTAESLKAL
ncbi:Nuclear MIS12/MIND complex subunit PMF1/Nnf1 [Pleurotus pulmonarius]|nr:hypothetical protein EYR38_008867 [Pleurotus pulmonarius]